MSDEQKKKKLQSKKSAESPKSNKIETALRESDGVQFVTAQEAVTDAIGAEGLERTQMQRKRLKVVSLITTALVVLFGGGWLAYAFYQDSNNVVTTAIAKVFASQSFVTTGTMLYGSQMRVEFDTQFSHADGYGGHAEFSFGSTNGNEENTKVVSQVAGKPSDDVYFRVKNLGTMFDALLEPYAVIGKTNQIIGVILDTYRGKFQPIIDSIDNQWIKYGPSEIRKFNEARAVAFECMQEVVWGVNDDTAQLLGLGLAYQNNRFVVVKESLGIVDGNFGFVVDVDKKVFKQFGKAFKASKLYSDLQACSKDIDELFSAFENDVDTSKISIQMWIDQWSHQLKKIHIEDEEDEFSIDIKFSFDKSVKITLPKESISYGKVAPEVDSLMGILGLGTLISK